MSSIRPGQLRAWNRKVLEKGYKWLVQGDLFLVLEERPQVTTPGDKEAVNGWYYQEITVNLVLWPDQPWSTPEALLECSDPVEG